MDSSLFAQINTVISVREGQILSRQDFEELLCATDDEAVSLKLQATRYPLDKEELGDPERIETVLLKHLVAEYDFAFQTSPSADLVQLFSLKYSYHNLKVLLKEKASQKDLSHLLIPIGWPPKTVLRQLVRTLSSEYCPELMQQELADTWAEYLDYRDVRILDIGMDLAYFKHLKNLADQLQNSAIRQFAVLSLEFYNLITVRRGLDQQKPHSFMRQLLSEEASLKAKDYLEFFSGQGLADWFQEVWPANFDPALATYENRLREGCVTALELEYLSDLMIFQVLEQGQFDTSGPLPLARYLWGKEMEVKNLRLILLGRYNGFDPAVLRERMRPIYGQ